MNAFDTLDSLHRSILNTAFDAGNGFHISIDRNEYAIDPAYGRIIPFQLFIHYSGVIVIRGYEKQVRLFTELSKARAVNYSEIAYDKEFLAEVEHGFRNSLCIKENIAFRLLVLNIATKNNHDAYSVFSEFSADMYIRNVRESEEAEIKDYGVKTGFICPEKSIHEGTAVGLYRRNTLVGICYTLDLPALYDEYGVISICIDEEFRAHGFGTTMVKYCVNLLKAHNKTPIYGYRMDNGASGSLVKKAGLDHYALLVRAEIRDA